LRRSVNSSRAFLNRIPDRIVLPLQYGVSAHGSAALARRKWLAIAFM
jgi:hypothetical protein